MNTEHELSPEQQGQLQEAVRKMVAAFEEIRDALIEFVQEFMERVRRLAEQLARFFLKRQLLEWRIPYRLADFIARKMYSSWALKIGWRWFHSNFPTLQ